MTDPPPASTSQPPSAFTQYLPSTSSTPNNFDNNSSQPTPTSTYPADDKEPPHMKPLRPMLARGAACDTCRARKVKCDASRPYCSPCLKSARGNVALASERCAYEGTSVAIATANRAAELQKNGGTKRKKRQPRGSGVTGKGEEDGEQAEGGSGGGTTRKRKKKAQSEDQEQGDDSRDRSKSLTGEDGRAEERTNSGGRVELPRLPNNQLPSVFMNPQAFQSNNGASRHQLQQPDHPYQPYGRGDTAAATSNAPWQQSSSRPLEAPYSHPASRFTLPTQPGSERYGEVKLPDPPVDGEKEQLAGRVAELERQLKLQADPQAGPSALPTPRPLNSSTSSLPQPLSNSYSSAYASPATGARSPSFPYTTYSSYAPPTPGYNSSYNSNYQMNSPSSSTFPPSSNPLSYSTSSTSSNSQYPPIQLAPPNSSSQYGSSNGALPLPLPLSNLQSYDPNRRRSLSTLSAIAGAVGMEDYSNGAGGSGLNSPMSNWSHHLQQQQQSSQDMNGGAGYNQSGGGGGVGGGYRFSTSSPVSSTRHLGTEPQTFALTSSTCSPGRTNWNTTTSSLRTEMTAGTASEEPAIQPMLSPPTATSSSAHSHSAGGSNTTSPSTTLPASVKTPPSSSDQSANHTANSTYFEPFEPEATSTTGGTGFPLLDMSYPPSLPPLSVLHHLVSTFFKRAAVPSTMLSKAKLLFTLSLSPTDPRWPDEALLHSICAYACMFVSEESLGGGEYGGLGFDTTGSGGGGLRLRYWEIEGDQSAKDYHYRKAKEAIEQALSLTRSSNPNRNLFQVLQSVILVCYVAYLSARFSDLWLLSGTATRLIAPLGLNHLEPWDFDRNRSGPPYQDWGIRVRKTERGELLGTVRNLSEHWERSCTFWLAFAVDRFASANTDWTTSIDEKDISTHLPCIANQPMSCLAIDPTLCHIPSLYPASPSFLQDTSAPIGSLGLYIKSTILLGRVVNYTQRFPRYLVIPPGESCSSFKRNIKASEDFIELDVSISKFKASHSANFFDSAGSSIDGFLASAYVIPHVATILLHETLTDKYDRTPNSSIARCLVAAKCIINSTYVLYQSSYDLGGVDPFLPFCWSVAGRALVRDFTTRQFWGEQEQAEQSKQLVDHCLSFTLHCSKQGSKICERMFETLKGYLENPENLLPLDEGCNVVFDLNDSKASTANGMSESERERELESLGGSLQ